MTPTFQKQILAVVGLLVLSGCGGSPLPSAADNPVNQTPQEVSTSEPPEATPVVAPTVDAPERITPPAPKPVAPPPAAPRATVPPPAPVVDYPPASQACESSTERVYSLGVMGSDCETARRVSAAYDSKVMKIGEWPGDTLLVDGWACRVSGSSGDGGEVHGLVCSQNSGTITFEWGV